MEYTSLSAVDISEGIKNKIFSAKEIITECLKVIDEKEAKIDSFISISREKALKDAEILDSKIAKGIPVGRLAGVPVAVKDNICTEGMKTTCASKMLEDFIPPYNATVVENILKDDAIIIGKTNMDEFAMGSSTENSAFKKTKNPFDLQRVPGGSSGGSAAVVGAKMVPLSLGSDTGGSIRQPASFCGVVGMKPTYGTVSRYGLIAFGSSLDQIGPFSRNIKDSALLLASISGTDIKDSTSLRNLGDLDYLRALNKSQKKLKIAVPKEFFSEGLDKEISKKIFKSIKLFEEMGAEINEVSLPISQDGLAAYYIISSAEASSNLSRYDGIRYGYRTKDFKDVDELIEKSRSEAFGDEVKRRIMIGTYALSSGYYDAYYNKAQKFRNKLKQEFKTIFESHDIMLSPTSPVQPFKLGEKLGNPLSMYLADIYTININLAGLPALSMPCGKSSLGLPIGLQIIGPHLGDLKILNAAYAIEQNLSI